MGVVYVCAWACGCMHTLAYVPTHGCSTLSSKSCSDSAFGQICYSWSDRYRPGVVRGSEGTGCWEGWRGGAVGPGC